MTKKRVLLEAAMSGGDMSLPDLTVVPLPSMGMPVNRPPKDEKLTVYVPRAAAKRLRQMALDNDRKVNDYLQEAVDMMLAKYGQKSLKEFAES